MGSAGLPGTGLGGLFYLTLALLMPVVELGRAVRGRSDAVRRRRVGVQFAIGAGIAGATIAVSYAATAGWGRVVGIGPVLISGLVLVSLLAVIRVWALLSGPPARHRRGRP